MKTTARKGEKIALQHRMDESPALEDDIDPEFAEALRAPAKIRITTMLDEDVYLELKRKAEALGTKYQTYLNTLLKRELFHSQKREVLEERLIRLEKRVAQIQRASARKKA